MNRRSLFRNLAAGAAPVHLPGGAPAVARDGDHKKRARFRTAIHLVQKTPVTSWSQYLPKPRNKIATHSTQGNSVSVGRYGYLDGRHISAGTN